MMVKNKDVSHNDKDGKKYDRTLYWCDINDIWISVEIPKENELVQ